MQAYPLVTVVGGSGFVGRHVVKRLAQDGWRVRVLVRDTIAAEFLKPLGNPGQIAVEHADITRPATLHGKFVGSDAVVSLVSILYEKGWQRFDAINIAGAKAVANEARRAGATRLVHVSALGVERASDTRYGRTKLAGELAVREAFPGATFLRPSLIIGPEDGFFQRFARMQLLSPFLPLIGGGKTRFQPVLVTDVALAVARALKRPGSAGKTYELAGPKTYRMRELLRLMGTITHRPTRFLPIPRPIAQVMGLACEIKARLLPLKPMITRDQVALLRHDNVASASAAGFSALGIEPQPIESQLPQFLARFIRG